MSEQGPNAPPASAKKYRVAAVGDLHVRLENRAQLADSLIAVIAQRLVYRPDLRIRVPECEILVGSPPVRNLVRQGHFYKLESALTTGGKEGMYTFERYQGWMAGRPRWNLPSAADLAEENADAAAENLWARRACQP